MDEDKDLLIRRAVFGKEVEQFLNSSVGRYMISRAHSEVSEAFELLKKCDPKDGKTVQHLQNQVWKAESINQWLSDAVTDGLAAINIIDDRS